MLSPRPADGDACILMAVWVPTTPSPTFSVWLIEICSWRGCTEGARDNESNEMLKPGNKIDPFPPRTLIINKLYLFSTHYTAPCAALDKALRGNIYGKIYCNLGFFPHKNNLFDTALVISIYIFIPS